MYRFYRYPVILLAVVMLVLLGLAPSGAHAQATTDNTIARPFVSHYWRYSGDQVLGLVQTYMMERDGYNVQYFEKGRLEDHSNETADPRWAVMYGRLTVEMMEHAPAYAINGTPLTYGDLYRYSYAKFPIPQGFTGGTMALDSGVFVPFDNDLNPAPGFIVPYYFWNYINRADLFPHGWLHDIGLPLTDVIEMDIMQQDGTYQTVQMQAFERSIVSYNSLNAPAWQVQRLNIGTDAVMAMGETPLYMEPVRPTGPKRIEIDLTRQRLYAYEGDFVVYNIPVSTGKDGWETPAGSFTVYSKLVSHDMRGDVAGESWYVPNVPHVMYFREGGYAIHGTYWHNTFGTGARLSHGCVNLPLDMAAALYNWAPIGTPVSIYY